MVVERERERAPLLPPPSLSPLPLPEIKKGQKFLLGEFSHLSGDEDPDGAYLS